MEIVVSKDTQIHNAPEFFKQEVRQSLTLKNPVFLEAERMNRWTGKIPEHIKCFKDDMLDGRLYVPRGFTRTVASMAKEYFVPFKCVDNTRSLPEVDFHFNGTLRPYQQTAADAAMQRRYGVIQLPTGGGKTVVALYIISQRRQPALIIVHTKELLNQWIQRIHTFLGIPKEEIGIIGNGKKLIGEMITVACVQTLYKCADEVSQHIGFLIVDEAHRTPSRVFTQAVTAFDSKFMLGLSATAFRRDGLDNLIFWHLGDLVYSMEQQDLTDNGAILPFRVKWVQTEYETDLDPSTQYTAVLSELAQDYQRNRLICRHAANQVANGGGIPMVLSDRKQHCRDIADIMKTQHGIDATVLTGDLPKKKREQVVDRLNNGDCDALVSTTQLLSEGFDCPSLGTVLLATPIKFKGRLIQSIGRALRPAEGQTHAEVIDFADSKVPVLRHSAKKRRQVYRDLNAID